MTPNSSQLGGPGTILLVDDEPHILHVLSVILRQGGYHVVATADGDEAKDLLRRHSVQLVITDVHMVSEDGTTLAAQLYADEETRDMPVVFLTGHTLNAERDLTPNVRAVIAKPFSPRRVLAEIERFVPTSFETKADAA